MSVISVMHPEESWSMNKITNGVQTSLPRAPARLAGSLHCKYFVTYPQPYFGLFSCGEAIWKQTGPIH